MDSPTSTATEPDQPDFPELVGPPCHHCGHATAMTGCSAHAFLLICPACDHRTSDSRHTVRLCLVPSDPKAGPAPARRVVDAPH